MDLGKYKKARRAMTRKQGGLRTVVFDPNITDTDVDFPDVEQPKMSFAGGGAAKKIIKKILSADDLRRLGKKEGISDEDIEKFLTGEYGLLKRGQARGVVKRDKEGNIFIKDTYSEKYDPIRKQPVTDDDPGMFDDLFDRMFGEYELEKFKKSGRKPNAEGGIQRENFKDGERAMTVTEKFKQANRAKQAAASEAAKKKFMEAEVTKPTPTSYGGKLGVKYADEAQQEAVEDLIKQKFSYPKNSKEGTLIDKYLMDEFDLNPASLERITRVTKNKYQLKNPKASEFYTGEKKKQRKIDEIRRGRVKELQGARLNIPKETGKEFHHVMPLAGKELITDKGVAAIDKKMNAELSRYNVQLNKNAERIKELSTQPDSPARRKEIEKINFSNKNIISKASKELPSQYRGLLGYYEYDTVDLNQPRKKKALDPKKTIGGLEGEELVFKKAKPEQIKSFKQKLSNIGRQDAINAIGSLGCPTNYADGGRVKFAQGSNCYAKGLQVIEAAKAGDTSALGKVKKFFKSPAGKVLGGVGAELAFETMFVLPDYAAGKPFDEILNATTFGLFGAGTSPDESLYKYSGNDPKVKEYQEIKKIEEQLQEDIQKFKDYQQNPERYRGMQQNLLRQSLNDLTNRIVENSKIYQQKKGILDPNGEYAQAMEQAKQIQQADYKKNIEESQGRQLVGKAGEKIMEGAKGVGEYIGKAYEYLKEKINPDLEGLDVTDEIVDEAALFANGGRVGFSEGGPGKMGRRGFLKLLGGIAALIGAAKAGLKFETKAAKQIIKNAPQGTPEWFAPLVEKIAKEGIDMSENLATQERQIVKELKVKNKYGTAYDDTYTLYENPDTGEISVDVDALGVGANEGQVTFHLRPKKTDVDPETGQQLVDEGEFIIEEDRAVGRVTSPDGDYDMDLEPTFVGMDDTASDIYGIEEFATGTTNKAKQREQLLKKDYVEKNPGEDISNRYGEYDPPEPDYD